MHSGASLGAPLKWWLVNVNVAESVMEVFLARDRVSHCNFVDTQEKRQNSHGPKFAWLHVSDVVLVCMSSSELYSSPSSAEWKLADVTTPVMQQLKESPIAFLLIVALSINSRS